MSMVAEAPGYLQVFSDGSVKRITPEIVPPSTEPLNGFIFKDVTIDPVKPITARMFKPVESDESGLPIMVYFHGGGFCIGSTTWLGYHHFLGDFSVVSKSIILSVDYRLAPENRLPNAYEDCYSSLEWLSNRESIEPWLERADLNRVFLSGDSAGGNIVHNVALRAIERKILGVTIKGLLPIHPFFGSQKRTTKEKEDGAVRDVEMNDMFWGLSIPKGQTRDYFGCNFETLNQFSLEWHKFPPTIIFVAGLDFLKERGVRYAKFLSEKGVKEVDLVEAKGEPHVFHVFYPESEATRLLQQQMTKFITSH